MLALLVLLGATAGATAHPGIGIVQDSRGNIYFTDLRQVWKVAPDGKKSVAVPGVHTHELCIDAQDNLYGEHLWYEGDATKKWGHRVWRLKPDGSVSDIIPAREGFLRDYSFVRDAGGNMYWAEAGQETVFKKRALDGKITTLATGPFPAVSWLTATPHGTVYFMTAGDLRRPTPDGKITLVASRLTGKTPPPSTVAIRHYHMGLWCDREGSVYVAVAAERLVLRVDAEGKTKVVARSESPWSPSGGMFDRDGNLWLLEYGSGNAVRARRIDREGREHIVGTDQG
jgi:sugar lactone lactonase YvrE